MSDLTLTRTERWILANQFRILQALESDFADEHRRAQTILQEGYEQEYEWIASHIAVETLSRDECKFVFDVLDMYRTLQLSQSKLTSGSTTTPDDVVFPGFDGNNETAYMAYARHTRSGGRFDEVRPATEDLNSHSPTLSSYRAMLREWETCKGSAEFGKHVLPEAEIKRVLAAR